MTSRSLTGPSGAGSTVVDAPPAPTAGGASSAPGATSPRGGLARTSALAVSVLLLLGCGVGSLAVGSLSIPPMRVLEILLSPENSQASSVVWDYRVPRTLTALGVGAALAVAGALMQALTRNPLADPGILGVEAGAVFAVAVAIAVFGVRGIGGYVWFAFAGAAVASVVVYLLGSGGRAGATPVRLALAGTAVSAALASTTQALVYLDRDAFREFQQWGTGALTGQSLGTLTVLAPFLLLGLGIAFALAAPLNTLALGDETSRSLGADPGTIRVWGAISITVLCGAATAAVGPVGFVGLLVAHTARLLAGTDQRRVLAWCLLLGPVLLVSADVLGRLVLWPDELAAGIVTALIGMPVFIALVRRGRVPRL